MTYSAILASPVGKIGIIVTNNKLAGIEFLPSATKTLPAQNAFSQKVVNALQSYFQHPKQPFSLDLLLAGTPFQRSVWRALLHIPVGTTITYGILAHQLNTSPRAIGQACRTNPVPIVIPCHRVVAMQHLGGYMGKQDGSTLGRKKWLLAHEGWTTTRATGTD